MYTGVSETSVEARLKGNVEIRVSAKNGEYCDKSYWYYWYHSKYCHDIENFSRTQKDSEVIALSKLVKEFEKRNYYPWNNKQGEVLIDGNIGPCKCCRRIIKQFAKDHPGLTVTVTYQRETKNKTVGGINGYRDAKEVKTRYKITIR